jgi:hypothetical protein
VLTAARICLSAAACFMVLACADESDRKRLVADDASAPAQDAQARDASAMLDAGPSPDPRTMDDAAPHDSAASDRDASRDASSVEADAGFMQAPPALVWRREDAPSGLTAIWGSGPNDIYVVGGAGYIGHSTGDGHWTEQDSKVGYRLSGIWGSIWGTSPTNLYLVTHFGGVYHGTAQ